ncbi:MAG: efflux RND transporter periplasmic adaptor subunit [Bryobacterales bacterium]|nr:efflux RND transporter periplasmic adaptor subunit [Bryobacterales bacterium]
MKLLVLPLLSVLVLPTGCRRADTPVADSARAEQPLRERDEIVLPPDSPKLKRIRTLTVAAAEYPADELIAPGKVEANPNRISRVLAPVSGRVRHVAAGLGDAVSEGQVLLTMESAEAGTSFSIQTQAQAHLRKARAALSKAEKDLARVRDLYEHRAAALKEVAGAENDLTQAQAEVEDAEAELQSARYRIEALGLKPESPTREVAVRAPIAGKVLEISVAPGEYRNDTNAPLMTIADLSTVWVTSEVPENSLRLITLGERVQIELAAYPGEVFQGRVRRIADMLDPQTRTVKVQAELDNRAGRLRPEMFGRIRHSHGTRSLPAVPETAVLEGSGTRTVLVERGLGRFAPTTVKTGEARNGMVPVLEGLKAGERVVVDGAILLRNQ